MPGAHTLFSGLLETVPRAKFHMAGLHAMAAAACTSARLANAGTLHAHKDRLHKKAAAVTRKGAKKRQCRPHGNNRGSNYCDSLVFGNAHPHRSYSSKKGEFGL